MEPDYKNWFPEKFVIQSGVKALIPLLLAIVFGAWGVGDLPVPIRLVLVFCYYHVRGMDRVDAILEALRTLKPGGIFVIHDLMTKGFYGERDILLKRVLESGCREAKLIPTDNGAFLTREEADRAMLTGSCLLVGRK